MKSKARGRENGLIRKKVKEGEMKGGRGRDGRGRKGVVRNEGGDVEGDGRKKWREVMRRDYARG